jgi:hypothetical protein
VKDLGVAARIARVLNGRINHATGAHHYQDDFDTPGISPRSASPRKHKRQMPNLRKNARGRPQILQRLCLRVVKILPFLQTHFLPSTAPFPRHFGHGLSGLFMSSGR